MQKNVEEFFTKLYENELQKNKNLGNLYERMKDALEKVTDNAYEKYVEKNGKIEKVVFLEGFHRFYDELEKEIKIEKKRIDEKEVLLEKLQSIDYKIYKDKKEFLLPIKKSIILLSLVNVIIILIVVFLLVDRPKPKEKPNEIAKVKGEMYFLQGEKHQRNKEYEEAYEKYFESSKFGHANSLYVLGIFHLKGTGVEVNYEKAYNYLLQASEIGFTKASYNLGIMELKGMGRKANKEKAKEYFLKASDIGESMYSLGNIYYLEKEYVEAKKYWEKGYELENRNSAKSLSNLYLYGVGTEKDKKKALEILTSSSNFD